MAQLSEKNKGKVACLSFEKENTHANSQTHMNLRCYGASRPKDETLCLALPSATKTKYEEEYELLGKKKKEEPLGND